MTDPDTLRALVAELCEAKQPRRVKDARIWCAINGIKFVHWNTRGVTYEGQERLRNGKPRCFTAPPVEVPHYTASLDAKLPGEDIAMVCAPGVQCAPKDRWYARCHSTAWVSALVATAHTEPLARRAAALLAMAERAEDAT